MSCTSFPRVATPRDRGFSESELSRTSQGSTYDDVAALTINQGQSTPKPPKVHEEATIDVNSKWKGKFRIYAGS